MQLLNSIILRKTRLFSLLARRLINRASSSKKEEDKAEIESLRRKLETQEEEFRLQQSTLFEELKTLSSQNEELKTQMSTYSDHPLEKEAGKPSIEKLEADIKNLTEEKRLLLEETIPSLNKKVATLKEELENCQTLNVELEDRLLAMTAEAEANLHEKEMVEEESVKVMQECEDLIKEHEEIVEEMQQRNKEIVDENRKLTEESLNVQKQILELTPKFEALRAEHKILTTENQMNQELSKKFAELQKEKQTLSEISQQEISDLKKELEVLKSENTRLSSEVQQNAEKTGQNHEKQLEDRVLLLETRYQLEVDDLKKSFEMEKEQLNQKVKILDEKVKSADEDKKLALKKSAAMVKELQKTLKDERKRADSYERKSEERSGWHVVSENDRQSSNTCDGNESVSSMSAIESENVELITRLATLQKERSENADQIIQLESENSRLRREVTEKGELIEHLIREKPLGAGFQPQNSFGNGQPKIEVSFRKFLNTLGQDSRDSDVREMNKKLQRMLEETLSKNIILQRDLQTIMERSGL
ncbi:hypothetical protein CAEBREN_18760 [Caenorhabditis brenneri]|uniref:GRIP domain-containing protein n=1 Tax=Caenorhabditis brenneri TaxID=135651 RepID=G0PBH8_CAEBE|nr:hypothetical protein CAEBREN_18760 [Caenorhabditis brenneri]